MRGRSSSYHALPGRSVGHVRRTSRTSSEFAAVTSSIHGNGGGSVGSGITSGAGSGNGAAHPPGGNASPNTLTTSIDNPWNDFSPRGNGGVSLPPSVPRQSKSGTVTLKRSRTTAPVTVFRQHKGAQRLMADARMAMKFRSRALFPRRVFIGLAFLFVTLVGVLYALLKRTYGIIGPPNTLLTPDAASNAQRIAHGLPPREYWPLKRRTRLSHLTAISKRVEISEVISVRNRNLPRRADYRSAVETRFPIRISLIASCKDRTGFLQTTLPTWLDALGSHDEIVLVDWGTSSTAHVPLMAVVEATKDSRINLVTTQNTNSWILSRAYNLAMAHARGEWILKVDCDTMLNSNFFDSLQFPSPPTITTNNAAVHISEISATTETNDNDDAANTQQSFLLSRHYYRFSTTDAKDENDHFLTGVFLIHSDDLRRVRGFDERITSYGWENVDLYDRLEKLTPGPTLVPKSFTPSSISHILHGEVFRAADRPDSGGPIFEAELNRLIISALGRWHTLDNLTTCTYSHRIASNDARYVFAEPERVLPAAIDSLPISTQESVLADARAHVLHNEYAIPLDVLSEVSRSRAELVRELARLKRSGEWAPQSGVVFAEIVGSPATRLLGVSCAVAIAQQHRRPLFIAWRPGDERGTKPDVRIDGVFDIAGAAIKGVHVFQVGNWPCQSTVDACAAADKAFARAVQFDAEADLASVEDTMVKQSEMNVVLRLDRVMNGMQRTQILRSLRALQPSTTLASVLSARSEALSTRQGIYLGPRLREHSIDAIAKRLTSGVTEGESAATYFVAGADRTLVRRARRALDSSLSINGEGVDQRLEGNILEFAEIFALARCRVMLNDGRTPQDVFEAVSALKESMST